MGAHAGWGPPVAIEDELLARTAKLGGEHEQRHLDELRELADDTVAIIGRPKYTAEGLTAAAEQTMRAVERRAPVIYQAAMFDGRFAGFADFAFYRIALTGAHLVAGFGRIVDLKAQDILTETGDAGELIAAEPDVLAHMNDDPDSGTSSAQHVGSAYSYNRNAVEGSFVEVGPVKQEPHTVVVELIRAGDIDRLKGINFC